MSSAHRLAWGASRVSSRVGCLAAAAAAAAAGCNDGVTLDFLLEDPSATTPSSRVSEADASTSLPPLSSPNGDDAGDDDGGRDAPDDAANDDADVGASPPSQPGDPCTTVDEIVSRSCGKCGTWQSICQPDVDGNLVWSVYGPCEDEIGSCAPGDVQACGDCGRQTCTSLCSWDVCANEPADHCSPGTVDHTIAGCPSGGFKSRACGASCQWSDYSLVCSVPTAEALFAGASSYSTYMIGSDGALYAWGRDDKGQLGDGDITNKSRITPSSFGNVVSVQGGGIGTYPFACASFGNGSAKCWGDINASYTLGDGSTGTSLKGVTPTTFDENVVSLTTGYGHGCGLFANGTAKCWGYNLYGQLGNGTTTVSETPATILGLANVSRLSSGSYTTCARTNAGEAYCWGYNTYGQIGDGTTTSRSTPTRSIASGVSAVTPGSYHACAVMTDGSAKCWGQNTSGEVGNAAGGASAPNITSPVTVAGIDGSGQLAGVSEICAGYGFSCARLEDGRVACWGKNDKGQLGNGSSVTFSNAPKIVSNITAASRLACGYVHACAIDGNQIKCWGDNQYGQLGNGQMPTIATTPQLATF